VRLVFSLLAASLLLAPASYADSATDTMRAFGLTGTWSQNCAIPGTIRQTYAFRPGAPATIILSANNAADGSGTLELEVQSAVRVTEDKLRLIAVFVAKNGVRGPKASDPNTSIVERVGNKMLIDGALNERCLD
jgi:hypothetical protein